VKNNRFEKPFCEGKLVIFFEKKASTPVIPPF
jgi:hypothetical protein